MTRAVVVLVATATLLASSGPAGAVEPPPEPKYALGARIRGLFVSNAMLSTFLTTGTEMNGMSGAVTFTYRKRTYDVVTSLDLTFLPLRDGNFLGKGRDPTQDVHYVQFGSWGQLSFLSLDVAIIGHNPLTRWLEIRYGGGVGLGLVIGDILMINNGRQCTAANAGDPTKCFPVSPTVGPIPIGQPDTEARLKATEDPKQQDLADDPHRHVTPDKPPVMVVVNLLIGFRFKVHRRLHFDIEGGFRNGAFFGGAFGIPF
jgi:hypothetical protein